MPDPVDRIAARVADDLSLAELEFLPASGVTGKLELSLPQLTSMIGFLGEIRARMNNGADGELVGKKIDAAVNRKWWIEAEPLTEGVLLCFDHPSFGALGFVVPRDQIERMIELLVANLAIPPQSSGLPS